MYNWFNKTLSRKRDEWVTDSDGNKLYTQKGTATDFLGNLQQGTIEQSEQFQLKFGKNYNFYTQPDADIKEGDILEDDSDTYTVRAVKEYKSTKTKNDHLHIILEK